MDFGQLAGPGPLRLHSAVNRTDLSRGTGALERAGHLSFRRCFWRNGPSPAGNDSRLRRSRVIPAFQMALHFCADFFGGRLRRVFDLGS